jgi:hypothetical protein
MNTPVEEEICSEFVDSKPFHRRRRRQPQATIRRRLVDAIIIIKLVLTLISMLNNPQDDCSQKRDIIPYATFALTTAPTILRGMNPDRRIKVSSSSSSSSSSKGASHPLFSHKINTISSRRVQNRRGMQFEQAQRRGRQFSNMFSSSPLSSSSSSSTALHMVLTTPESIIEQASTVNLLDDLINESVRTSARRPIMMQFDPSSGWIWRRWKGTVFAETWISCGKSL